MYVLFSPQHLRSRKKKIEDNVLNAWFSVLSYLVLNTFLKNKCIYQPSSIYTVSSNGLLILKQNIQQKNNNNNKWPDWKDTTWKRQVKILQRERGVYRTAVSQGSLEHEDSKISHAWKVISSRIWLTDLGWQLNTSVQNCSELSSSCKVKGTARGKEKNDSWYLNAVRLSLGKAFTTIQNI